MYLQLMRNTSGHALLFNNEQNLIFGLIGSKTVFFDEFNTPTFLQRWQFVPDNGTLIINPAERRDGGTYRVEIYKSTVGYHTVQLIVKGKSLHLASCEYQKIIKVLEFRNLRNSAYIKMRNPAILRPNSSVYDLQKLRYRWAGRTRTKRARQNLDVARVTVNDSTLVLFLMVKLARNR